jgi:hypothetical protein
VLDAVLIMSFTLFQSFSFLSLDRWPQMGARTPPLTCAERALEMGQ